MNILMSRWSQEFTHFCSVSSRLPENNQLQHKRAVNHSSEQNPLLKPENVIGVLQMFELQVLLVSVSYGM